MIDFLREILKTLKQAEYGVSKKTLEKQLMAQIVPFNTQRLNYYWSVLDKDLDLCVKRLEFLEETTSELSSTIP